MYKEGSRGASRNWQRGGSRGRSWHVDFRERRENSYRGRGRGGYPGQDRLRARSSTPFHINDVAEIEDIDQLTLNMNSQLEAFKEFLSVDSMETDDAASTLRVINRVLENEVQRETVLKILQVVCVSRFLDAHLLGLIQKLPSLSDSEVIENTYLLHHLLLHICQKLPSYASKGFLLVTVLTGNSSVAEVLENCKPTLAESLKELLEECRRNMTMIHEVGLGGKQYRYRFRPGPNDDSEIPPEDFDRLPLFPSAQDMNWNEKIFLRANKEEGAFRDINHYLDVQFRLMREDYMRPLRKGIREYKQLATFTDKPVTKVEDLRIYHNVEIIGIVCGDRVEHQVRFDMTNLTGVRWESSKRLIFGSLICLSLDNFDTLFFAVVTDRSSKELEKGTVQICFETGPEDIFDLPKDSRFTMVETSAFFESYRHVLEGLRGMKNSVPLSQYIVDCNPSISAPQYLLSDGQMDLSALLKHKSRHSADCVSVLNPQTWPPLEETNLNQSQMEAVKTALSKELAIVQGPPGTGKTYIGLKIVEILLKNQQVWTDPQIGKRPILVVCYTNHALDQFLEGILDFCETGIVRVGGRCKSERLERFNLKNIHGSHDSELMKQKDECKRRLEGLKYRIECASTKLDVCEKVIVNIGIMKQFMLDGQFDSLTKKDICSGSVTVNMLQWLSDGVLTGNESRQEVDPHHVIAKEVTSKIINGKGTCNENDIDPKKVHLLPSFEKARVYRFWLEKALTALQGDITKARAKGHDPQNALEWQDLARKEILPDRVLRQSMSKRLYHAITDRMRNDLERQMNYTIRAWLGVSQKVLLNDRFSRDSLRCVTDHNLDLQTLNELPQTTRRELYWLWLHRVRDLFTELAHQHQDACHVLHLSEREILPDNILMDVVDQELFAAIQKEMRYRYSQQSGYLIGLWLGLDYFYQNAFSLEKLLEALDADDKGHLKVDEEAEVIQNERLLDFDNVNRGPLFSVRDAISELKDKPSRGHHARAQTKHGAEEEEFSIPVHQKKALKKKILHLRSALKPMSEEEARNCVDLWSPALTTEKRISLYLFWLQKYKISLKEDMKNSVEEYDTESQQHQELRFVMHMNVLNKAKVIGMTTTGAARLRSVLNRVACPIVILEEAAEVLEAHVVTSLHEKCHHLILIGDHQQLRPSPTVYELCRHYKLDLSLFERLINNHLHHTTLMVQHRMRPEISRFVRHVYPSLEDHWTTLNRPHVRGLKENVFLFHHEVEERVSSETGSKSNYCEAELCVRLCRYLLQQDYPPGTITILAAYSGQVYTLWNIMKKDEEFYKDVRVTSVDNYQGEENEIVILSLVRNNVEGTVGFLGSDNRICVAMSRAKNGFYAFGNFSILANKSQLWENICRTATDHGQLGEELILQCKNHPQNQVQITTAEDFDKAPEGGCHLPCEVILDCGHMCTRVCHGYDQDHSKFRCEKACDRITCKLGHPCLKKCHESCDECMYMMEKTFPVCGHKAKMECFRTPNNKFCRFTCLKQLPCGHSCKQKCGICLEKRNHTMEEERKIQSDKFPSNTPLGEPRCSHPCSAVLDCGHKCQGSCSSCWGGRVHITCRNKCSRALPGCGHKCPLTCASVCLPCKEACHTKHCRHSTCQLSCGKPCQPCKKPCPWKKCPHKKCHALCHEPCKPCLEPCQKSLKCGHVCSSFCGERCACLTCDKKNFVPLVDVTEKPDAELSLDGNTKLIKLCCGHAFNADHLDAHFENLRHSLFPWDPLRCPLDSCKTIVKYGDCWRYADMQKARHNSLQEAKLELIRRTDVVVVNEKPYQKLKESTQLLKCGTSQLSRYYSGFEIELPEQDGALDVNEVFALINQIKLAKVLEQSADILTIYTKNCDTADLKIIWKLLADSKMLMTMQRLRELSVATRRIAYIAKLTEAKRFRGKNESMEKLDAYLKTLREDWNLQQICLTDMDKILEDCMKHGVIFRYRKLEVDIAVLDAPANQHLCDVGKPCHALESADVTETKSAELTLKESACWADQQQVTKPLASSQHRTFTQSWVKQPKSAEDSKRKIFDTSSQKKHGISYKERPVQQRHLGPSVMKQAGASEKNPRERPSSSHRTTANDSRQKLLSPPEGSAVPSNSQQNASLSRARRAAEEFQMDTSTPSQKHHGDFLSKNTMSRGRMTGSAGKTKDYRFPRHHSSSASSARAHRTDPPQGF